MASKAEIEINFLVKSSVVKIRNAIPMTEEKKKELESH